MFTQSFEKNAGIGKALKGIGLAMIESGKGVGHGLKYLGKRSVDKVITESPKLKKGWKGFSNPESYKAVAELATKLSPEMAMLGAAGYTTKKLMDPNYQQDATLAYY